MSEKGMVTVAKRHGKVLMKILTKRGGENAKQLKKEIEESWPLSVEQAYALALENGFGTKAGLAVVTEREELFKGKGTLPASCRETLQFPAVNPQLKTGQSANYALAIV